MATRAAARRTPRPAARKGAARTAAARKPAGRRAADGAELRSRVLAFLLVAVGVAILVALGVWQLQRLHWKQNLLARIAALQDAPAEPLNVVLNRVHDGGEVDFVRVQTRCPTLESTPTLRLYALTDSTIGYRLITACPIEDAAGYRTILVDRGFVARDAADRVPKSAPPVEGPVTGVLRVPDKPSWLTPKHASPDADWYGRDAAAMAATLGASAPAPLFLMLESPKPHGFGPTPAPVPVDIPNRHFEYALTWFGLAAALVGVYIASLFARRSVGRR